MKSVPCSTFCVSSPPSGYRSVDGESLLFEFSKLTQVDTVILLKTDNVLCMCLPLRLVLCLALKVELAPSLILVHVTLLMLHFMHLD